MFTPLPGLGRALHVEIARRFPLTIVIGANLAAVTVPACAQEAKQIPHIIVTANQIPLDAERVGASVTVLNGDVLREKNIATVAEALRTVPGVTVTPSGGSGTLTEVRIRGDEANHLTVLLDGIEINSLGDGGFDFADLPVDDIERIEVIRGPQSGIYGANAQSGVISIITLGGKGLRHPVAQARIEGGNMGTVRGSANVRGAFGPAYGSVTVTDYSTAGYNISRFGSERDGSRAFTVTAKAGADLSDNLNVEGVVRHTDRNVATDPQDFNFGSPTYGYVVDGNAATGYVSTAGRVGATLSLFGGHWVQSAHANFFDEQVRGLQSGALNFGADGTRTTVDYKSTFYADTNLFGGEKHALTVLVDNRHEHYVPVTPPADYRKERTGLAGEYVLDLPTNTTLTGALRQDWNTGFADVVTWRLALSQRFPSMGTRLHASAGKGVSDPNVFELFGSTFNLPNPNLKPEQTIGWDAGVEQSLFAGRIVGDVTYFSTDFTDKIEFTFDPVTFNAIYVNGVGTATRRGVEVSGTFLLLDWLTLKAAYTYTDAKDSFGNEEIRRPPHSGSIDATARFADNRATASVGVAYNGVRTDYFFQPTGTQIVDLPAVAVVRASLSYDVMHNVTAYVRAENLFNAHYEEVFSYRAPGFAVLAGLKLRVGD